MVSSVVRQPAEMAGLEGSQARLPAPSPRGTERDSFPSLGSSSTKASLNTCRPGHSECSPSDLRDTDPQPLYMSFDNVGGAHARDAASICFPPHQRFSELSRDVPPIGRGLAFAPGNVKTRIRSITERHSLFPTSYTRTAMGRLCSLLSPKGAIRGFHVPLAKHIGLGACCRPGGVWVTKAQT